jgi:CYTH domain-containing protein
MGVEIERKFLVAQDGWRASADGGRVFRQGYLSTGERGTVRVRLAGEEAWLTIKGPSRGTVRAEYEYAIPAADAAELLALCEPVIIDKTRFRVPHGGFVWEVDVFAGENDGLVVAEVELAQEEDRPDLPDWLGQEVTGDPRYRNSSLSQHPFTRW